MPATFGKSVRLWFVRVVRKSRPRVAVVGANIDGDGRVRGACGCNGNQHQGDEQTPASGDRVKAGWSRHKLRELRWRAKEPACANTHHGLASSLAPGQSPLRNRTAVMRPAMVRRSHGGHGERLACDGDAPKSHPLSLLNENAMNAAEEPHAVLNCAIGKRPAPASGPPGNAPPHRRNARRFQGPSPGSRAPAPDPDPVATPVRIGRSLPGRAPP